GGEGELRAFGGDSIGESAEDGGSIRFTDGDLERAAGAERRRAVVSNAHGEIIKVWPLVFGGHPSEDAGGGADGGPGGRGDQRIGQRLRRIIRVMADRGESEQDTFVDRFVTDGIEGRGGVAGARTDVGSPRRGAGK